MRFIKRIVVLWAAVLCVSVSVFAAEKAQEVNFIYRGDFQQTRYITGNQLQNYWALAPWQDTSGFAIEREEEGGQAQAILKINYSEKPKNPKGWESIKVAVEFLGVPESPTKISFKACGQGTIEASVFEYTLKPGPKNKVKNVYAGRHGGLGDRLLTKEWKTYEFQYNPTGRPNLGRVGMVFYFKPSAMGRLNVHLDDVQAIAQARHAVGEPSALTIPKLPQTPVIDGAFSEDEWASAIPLSAFTKANVFMPPSGAQTAWVGYDEEALYIAFRADDGDAPVATTHKRDTGVWDDDSVEILLASVDLNRRAHFILNAVNSIYDSNGDIAWNPAWRHATRQDARGWQAEVAIPWEILGWEHQPGAVLRMNIGHNDVIVDEAKNIHNINSWAAAHRPGTSHADFSQTGLYPIARLDTQGIVAGVTLQYDSRTSKPILNLNVINATSAPTEVICAYGTDSGIAGRITLPCRQDGRTVLPIPVNLYGSDRHGYVNLKVFNKENALLYAHREIFKTGFSEAIALNYLFPINAVELAVDISSLPNFKVAYKAQDPAGKVVNEKITACTAGMTKIRVDISKWDYEKTYRLSAEIQDQDGTALAQKTFEVVRPDREPWLGTRLGLTDEPLPPFTPIEIDGKAIKCLMKEYGYAGRVLPVSVKSEGRELLAAPVSLKLSCAGKEADLAAASFTVTSRKANRVEWQAEYAHQGINAQWKCWMEEDGFAWYELTLDSKKPVQVDRLALVVPLEKQYAKLIVAAPFAITGGDMEGQFVLRPEGWQAIDHKQVLSVMSEDRGLEITSEDNRYWSNKVMGRGQSISVGSDQAKILYAFIDNPIVLQGRRTYGFGLQAFPVKPIVRNRDVRYMAANRTHYSYVATSGDKEAAYIKYPLQGNLDLEQGTLEAWVYAGFDSQKPYAYVGKYTGLQAQKFFDVIAGKAKGSLIWDQRRSGWAFVSKSGRLNLYGKTEGPWEKPGWHHVAMTWGDAVRIFDDGKLIGEQKAKGLLAGDAAGAFFGLGKQSPGEYSAFRITGLRISSKALSVSEMALKGDFTKTPDTLLLENYAACGPDRKSSAPVAGTKGVLAGSATFDTFEGKPVLALGSLFPKSRLDVIAELGYKGLLSHGAFTERHSLPYFETKRRALAFKTYVNECHARDMNVFVGVSFGVGFGSREDTLYGHYWYAHPVHLCGYEGNPLGIKTFCVSLPLVTDYYLYYWDKLIKEFNVDGLYTDNTFVAGAQCQNEIHGCGLRDANGLRQTGNLLAGRRFAKRLYALCKMRERPVIHYMHSSRCNHAMYASWADQYLCGEQYRAHASEKGWNVDLNQFRAENLAERYGLESHQVSGLVPYGHQGVIAVGLLHGVTVVDCVWRNWPDRLIENAAPWKVMDQFGESTAKFLPYWKNAEFVTSRQDKRQYVTLWWHPGKRALALVANLEWKKADVTVEFNLKKLGIAGRAKGSYTGEKIPMSNGKLTVPLEAYKMKLVWIE